MKSDFQKKWVKERLSPRPKTGDARLMWYKWEEWVPQTQLEYDRFRWQFPPKFRENMDYYDPAWRIAKKSAYLKFGR